VSAADTFPDTAPSPAPDPRAALGDLPPAIVTPPPGPRSRERSRRIAAAEAPGVNTLSGEAPSLFWHEAAGANVVDVDGNRFVDLAAGFGVAAVGHRHPRVAVAIRQQSERLLHGLGDVHPHALRVALAERLAARVPVAAGAAGARVHFGISGAEAVEIAVKTALLATGRPAVVAFEPAYHGLTAGALALSSRAAFRRPFAAHLHPHVVRLPYGGDPAAVAARLAAGDVAAVVVEPIVGREGVLLPPAGWLPALAAACREHGALLVADEVFTGFGRTGRWFAVEHDQVVPDLMSVAKGITSGYVPLSASIARARLADAFSDTTTQENVHPNTYAAHPVACAAALANLRIMEQDKLVANAAAMGARLLEGLRGAVGKHPIVGEVRGRGLLVCVDFVEPDGSGKPLDAKLVAELDRKAWDRGAIIYARGTVLRLAPPLCITLAEVDELVAVVADCVDSLQRDVAASR
jgi:4-aminobutyrate aminotransferase-like enzyme